MTLVTQGLIFKITNDACFIIVIYLATICGPECGPSSGHCSRTRK